MADEGDIFDSVLFLEERCHKDGFSEGWAAGSSKGLSAGRKLGLEKGQELGSEIGFIGGFVSTWLVLINHTQKKNTRVITQLKSLQTLIDELPLTEPTNENLFSNIEKVRAKFKQVCSLLGVNPTKYQDNSQKALSF